MKYFNNDYKTCGTAALKPQAGRDLVLVQGGSIAGRPDGPGRCDASSGSGFFAGALIDFICDVAERIEPLPEPIAKSCEPTRQQEIAGVVACLGCVSAVLLLATFVQALI